MTKRWIMSGVFTLALLGGGACGDSAAGGGASGLALGTPMTVNVPAGEGPAGQVHIGLTIAAPGAYTCDAVSTTHDAQMAIVQGANVIVQDSDSGEGTNSRITQTLQAGAYQVRVWEWLHRATQITVTCNAAVAAPAATPTPAPAAPAPAPTAVPVPIPTPTAAAGSACARARACCTAYVAALADGSSAALTCAPIDAVQNSPLADVTCNGLITTWRATLQQASRAVPSACQ